MKPDEFDITSEGAGRLLADLATTPQSPAGEHLDAEALAGLVTSSLSAASEAEALAHLVSCPFCAELAAAEAQGVISAKMAGQASLLTAQHAFVQLIAVAAVTVARRGAVKRRLATRGIDWKSMSGEGFSCAVLEGPAQEPSFAIRSTIDKWAELPLRCAIRNTGSGAMWAEAWFVMHGDRADAHVACEATLRLGTRSPWPAEWNAEINRCAFDATQPPTATELESLRHAITSSSARDLDAWRRWLDDEVRNGHLAASIRRSLLPA